MAYPEALWSEISSEAKDLCQKMITKSPQDRITPSEALTHAWFSKDFAECGTINRDMQDIYNQRRLMAGQGGRVADLVSATPVMAGVRIMSAPPMSPFINPSSDFRSNNRTPIITMRQRNEAQNAASAGGGNNARPIQIGLQGGVYMNNPQQMVVPSFGGNTP